MAVRFNRNTSKDEPEINLIPFIDVLLVIIIFLVLTTTYNKYREIQLQLPSANSQLKDNQSKKVELIILENGNFVLNNTSFSNDQTSELLNSFIEQKKLFNDAVVVISADAMTSHQAVITAMEVAQQAGFQKITFTTNFEKK